MKAELIINNTTLKLGHKELNEISYILDDCPTTKDIYHEMAQLASTETRTNIASQNYLHKKTIALLMSDSQTDVMRAVTSRDKFISEMTKEDIEKFIATGDSEILTNIVENISELTEEYEICEKDWLCEKLFQQITDPLVKYELASTGETSRLILKKLINDSDISVSQAAKTTLEDLDFETDEEEDEEEEDFSL